MDKRKTTRRNGFYWVNSKPYISVTNVLSIIDKPALMYWFGQQVFRAIVIDPGLLDDEKEALRSPYRTSKKAMFRGTTVHKMVEDYSGKKITSADKDLQGYYDAYHDWSQATDFEIIEHERTVTSHKHKFAGTLDILAKSKSGETYIIDIKTGKDIYPETSLQLSAYKQGLKEDGIKIDKLAVLLLKEDGNYKFEIVPYALKAFLSAKDLYEWKNSNKLEKYGY